MIDYDKLRGYHHARRLREIAMLFDNRNPILDLNTGIIDNNKEKSRINEMKLELFGYKSADKHFDYLKEKKRLDISYLLPHNHVSGGLKILIEQANNIQSRGHNVSLYCHLPKPEWIDIKCDYFQVPPDKALHEAVLETDVIIAGYWDLIIDAVKNHTPLKYYMAQGDKHIFEYQNLQPFYRNVAFTAFQLPVRILTVSKQMQKKIKKLYGRKSIIIPNAIDEKIFYLLKNKENNPLQILIIGYDSLAFKGHDDIIKALSCLKKQGYNFGVRWAMPSPPQRDFSSTGLDIMYHNSPTQEELGRIYRTSDIYISGSYYESFSLPPLEAMASGTAVVTTSNEGVKEYAINNQNCLMYEPGNIEQLVAKVKLLINSEDLRNKLIYEGLKTVRNYGWENSINILEDEILKNKDNLKIVLLD